MGTQAGTREWKHRHIQIEVRLSLDPHHTCILEALGWSPKCFAISEPGSSVVKDIWGNIPVLVPYAQAETS